MHSGSDRGARFDTKGHGAADRPRPVKNFAAFDGLLPIRCAATKTSMGKPCLPVIHFLPGVDTADFFGDLLHHFSLDEHSSESCQDLYAKLFAVSIMQDNLRFNG